MIGEKAIAFNRFCVMNMNSVLESIREEAQRLMTARGSHDWSHTERVHNLCMHIGKKESADLHILSLAAFLHDIGRGKQDKTNGSICHAERGATMARELLQRHNLDERKMGKIIHCIENHRFRGGKVPRTKEAQVLYDADKLDSLGYWYRKGFFICRRSGCPRTQ